MFHKYGNRRRSWRERAFSLFLTAVLLLGSVPGLALPASAHWADSYLDQMVDWGVMRADQINDPDTPLTRAEFMAIINRAYGYTETGPIPFEDVSESDWFYDDVAIAYNAGYMKGTSKTTAAPNSRLTREQAICILGRNMMLKEMPGEDLAFADSRSISGWARGMVKAAVNNYIVNGYPDGTFRPKDNITKGQMAALVTQCLGTPVNGSGTFELGDVSGNVTITSPNVTLRNTTISGDLYVSGGVGLGGVKLENVDVLGRIVVSGTGESEGGAASVIMRNVNASELLVDNMRKKYVTVRADGITEIARTTVRTNAYLEDNNTDDKGLLNITLEGKSGTRLDLAGRIKNVLDKTPDSFIQVAKGTVQKLTVDEAATNSVIQINRNTEVKELNLDVAANVNGEGDVGKLNINAPGSTVTMLPDEIYIRPGITGNVNGSVMDSAAAEEASLDPRLLSGYPAANDVAPTGFRADFAGNKKGTVYWAVSDIADGSIGAEDLISPPSYGSKAVRGGSVGVPAGDTVGSTQVSGLTVGGSYYLSAVLVDGRGDRSPVKVISFTTPDNSKPAFAQGYPYMSLITNIMAQVTVMPTKTCKLYYAVLPKGAPAPTMAEMRSAAVTGNLGYGIVDVVKNTERVINVSNRLQELKEYTLYLWLSDADGVNSSSIVSLQFKTVDKTPPRFNPDPDPRNAVQEDTSVKLTAGLNETGTIYWVAVAKDKPYPPAATDPDSKENTTDANGNLVASLSSQTAKIAVKNHTGASIYGSVKVSKADTEFPIDVKGLKAATAYDFYYVAEDTAGNFSDTVKKITIRTEDGEGPVVTQYFRNPATGENPAAPRIADEVILQFSEDIKVGTSTVSLREMRPSELEAALRENFQLYYIDELDNNNKKLVPQKTTDNQDGLHWVDYSQVTVRQAKGKEGCIEVVFLPNQGIKLASGRTYYFNLTRITDMSGNNPQGFENDYDPEVNYVSLEGKKTDHVLGTFTTAEASLILAEIGKEQRDQPVFVPNGGNSQGRVNGGTRTANSAEVYLARVDCSFFFIPDSTQSVKDTTCYDIALFSGEAMDYDIYYRILDPNTGNEVTPETNKDDHGWFYMGNVKSRMAGDSTWDATAANLHAQRPGHTAVLPKLNTLMQGMRYEFAVSATRVGGREDRDNDYNAWSEKFDVQVGVVAGIEQDLNDALSTADTPDGLKKDDRVEVVSVPEFITMNVSFNPRQAPRFKDGPSFEPDFNGVPTAKMTFQLDNPGTLYYRIVPKDQPLSGTQVTMRKGVLKQDDDGNVVAGVYKIAADTVIHSGMTLTSDYKKWTDVLWDAVVAQTTTEDCGQLYSGSLEYYSVDAPAASTITQRPAISETCTTRKMTIDLDCKEDNFKWERNEKYLIYIVLRSETKIDSPVYLYEFESGDVKRPKISARQDGEDFFVTTGVPNTKDGMETNFRWMILQKEVAMNLFNQSFTIGVEGADGNPSYMSGKNLLEALSTNFDSDAYYKGTDKEAEKDSRKFDQTWNGYTVFDVLAGPDLRRNVYRPFADANTEITEIRPYVIEEGEKYVTKEKNKTYTWNGSWTDVIRDRPEFKDTIETTEYLILVVGRSKLFDDKMIDETVDSDEILRVSSFRAIPSVSLESKSKPDLVNAKLNSPGLSKTDTGEVLVKGSFAIQFEQNRPVYWKQYGDNTYYQVTKGASEPDPDKKTVGILYQEDVPGDWPFTSASGGPSYFTLNFGPTRGSEYNILSGQGFFVEGGGDAGGPLIINLTTKEDAEKPGWYYAEWTVEYCVPEQEGYKIFSGRSSSQDLTNIPETKPDAPALNRSETEQESKKLKDTLDGKNGNAEIKLVFNQWLYDKAGDRIEDITTDQRVVSGSGLVVSKQDSYGSTYGLSLTGISATRSKVRLLSNTEVYVKKNGVSGGPYTFQALEIEAWKDANDLAHVAIYFEGTKITQVDEDPPVTAPKLQTARITGLDGGAGTAKVELTFDKPLYDAAGTRISSIIKGANVSGKAKITSGAPSGNTYTITVSGIDKSGSTITLLPGVEVYDATGKAHAQKDIKIEVKLQDSSSGVFANRPSAQRPKLAWMKVTSGDLAKPEEKTQS